MEYRISARLVAGRPEPNPPAADALPGHAWPQHHLAGRRWHHAVLVNASCAARDHTVSRPSGVDGELGVEFAAGADVQENVSDQRWHPREGGDEPVDEGRNAEPSSAP
jgi:hypothetical protein